MINTYSPDIVPDENQMEDSHVKRVESLAYEIARGLGLENDVFQTLHRAAWLNRNESSLTPDQRLCLIWNLERAASNGELTDFKKLTPKVSADLRKALESCGPVDIDERVISIIALANAFDEAFESRQLNSNPSSELIQTLRNQFDNHKWTQEIFEPFLALSAGNLQQILEKADKLPIMAISALRNLALMPIDELTVHGLTGIASQDPVLTAELLRAANSARYTVRERIPSLLGAINYIGVLSARQVMLAVSARGIFVSAHLNRLWKHSVKSAAFMSDAAAYAGCDPSEAFLVGLLHDIGRVALELHSTSSKERLRDIEAPAIWLELITVGCDHASIGAMLLSEWNFPENIVEAIRYHHHPDLTSSKLSALMCAVESINYSNEDLLSVSQYQAALAITGMTKGQPEHTESPLDTLMRAAS